VSSIASDRINRRACLPGVLGTPMLVLALAGCQFSASADGGLDYEKLEGAITSNGQADNPPENQAPIKDE